MSVMDITPIDPLAWEVHNVTSSIRLPVATNMKALIVVAVLLSIANAQAPMPEDAVLERLARVEIFAFGPTGYAGITSQGEKDYRAILSRSSASVDFEQLFSLGNSQAKSYALVGLRAVSPNRFKEISSSLHDSKEDVTTERGCIVSHESLGTVLKHVGAGDYVTGRSSR
jgi:hypothetical protein